MVQLKLFYFPKMVLISLNTSNVMVQHARCTIIIALEGSLNTSNVMVQRYNYNKTTGHLEGLNTSNVMVQHLFFSIAILIAWSLNTSNVMVQR